MCENCNDAGIVFDCPLWPQCLCPDGTMRADCPGKTVKCECQEPEGHNPSTVTSSGSGSQAPKPNAAGWNRGFICLFDFQEGWITVPARAGYRWSFSKNYD